MSLKDKTQSLFADEIWLPCQPCHSGAWPRQPDRRAYRLQRRFCAALRYRLPDGDQLAQRATTVTCRVIAADYGNRNR